MPRLRHISAGLLTLAACLGLPGCSLLFPPATLILVNDSEFGTIREVRFMGPDQNGFAENRLARPLPPGASERFEFPAPRKNRDPIGVTYRVRVFFDLFDLPQPPNDAVFTCVHGGDSMRWDWRPGRTVNRCVN